MPRWVVKLAWSLFVALALGTVVLPVALAAERVIAEYVGQSGYPRITLLDVPCDGVAAVVVAQRVRPEHHAQFRGARSEWALQRGGVREFGGCWARFEPPLAAVAVYVVLFEDGDHVAVPVAEFRDQRLRLQRVPHSCTPWMVEA